MAEIEIVKSYNELVKSYGKYIDIIKTPISVLARDIKNAEK